MIKSIIHNNEVQRTDLGIYIHGDSEKILSEDLLETLRGKVQLIITSPPFPLNEKKSYGNLNGSNYKNWFVNFANIFSQLITPDGSIVIEMGNAWEPGKPEQSTLPLECLLDFVKHEKAGLKLCQEFVCYNPSRLPSPSQWVTVHPYRTTDSYTHIWWMSKTAIPKADNRKVLRPYSNSMKNLLKRKKYNAGKRPSGHNISQEGFLTDNGGSISQNFFETEPINSKIAPRLTNAFRLSNTDSNDFFSKTCRERGIERHPAPIQAGLISFFIEMLTDEKDLVLDPFGGTNTTGFIAELLNRHWVSIEIEEKYADQSRIRFEDPTLEDIKKTRKQKLNSEDLNIARDK